MDEIICINLEIIEELEEQLNGLKKIKSKNKNMKYLINNLICNIEILEEKIEIFYDILGRNK